jgi:hypothetical protein
MTQEERARRRKAQRERVRKKCAQIPLMPPDETSNRVLELNPDMQAIEALAREQQTQQT